LSVEFHHPLNMIYPVIVALAVASVASANLHTEDHVQQKAMFDAFKMNFAKKYSTMEEETRRFYLFVENLKTVDARNVEEKKAGGTAVHGITKFSDLSQVEFETRYLLSDPALKSDKRVVAPKRAAPVATMGEVNWAGKLTTPVKNQGYCGSCWAFSATEQIESDTMRTRGQTFVLSPEQITQCDKTSYGCDGGWTEHAYNYVQRAGGISTEDSYPYTSAAGVTGTCKDSSHTKVISVSGYTTIDGEDQMASYVQSTGPLSVCLDASKFNSYTGGVVQSCGNRVDHCVQAVGVDASSSGYWIVRNSWGEDWGEAGYIRLGYGQDMCAIASDPTWVTIADV